MKKIYLNLSVLLLFLLTISACKKDTVKMGAGASSFTIVNGLEADKGLMIYFNDADQNVPKYISARLFPYGEIQFYGSYSGQQKLGIYQTPGDPIVGKLVYNLTVDLPINTIHTLFLMGTPQDPYQLLTTDQLPYHVPADSTMGIRFINLSHDSAPVSINIKDKASGPEAANLAYKSITAFKNYPASSAVSSYTFEFRDQATGTLLASYTMNGVNSNGSSATGRNLWRNQNITLALLDQPAGAVSPSRVLVIRY